MRPPTDLLYEKVLGSLVRRYTVVPVPLIHKEDGVGQRQHDEDDAEDEEHDGYLTLLTHLLCCLARGCLPAATICDKRKWQRDI